MHSGTRLSLLLAVCLVTAGCLSAGPGAGPAPSPTPTADPETPTETASPGTPTSTATPGGHELAANQPDPHKKIGVVNDWNRTVTVRVRVVRDATDTTVHNGTHAIAPGTERTVYNTSAADPDGIEPFTVTMATGNSTERVTVETNRCYGDVSGEIRNDGSLYLFYAIC